MARWQDKAQCRDTPTSVFFPATYDARRKPVRRARQFCDACTVSQECLIENLWEKHGIFGGLTPKQREQHAATLNGQTPPAPFSTRTCRRCGTTEPAPRSASKDITADPWACQPCRAAANATRDRNQRDAIMSPCPDCGTERSRGLTKCSRCLSSPLSDKRRSTKVRHW